MASLSFDKVVNHLGSDADYVCYDRIDRLLSTILFSFSFYFGSTESCAALSELLNLCLSVLSSEKWYNMLTHFIGL